MSATETCGKCRASFTAEADSLAEVTEMIAGWRREHACSAPARSAESSGADGEGEVLRG